jgi:hypothetical protein
MTEALVALLAATLYLAAAAGLVRSLRTDPDTGRGAFWLALPAIGLHAAAHALAGPGWPGRTCTSSPRCRWWRWAWPRWARSPPPRSAWPRSGVIIYPLAAVLVLLYTFAGHGRAQALDWRLQLHAWLALLAYAALALSALIAILGWAQDRALRQRQLHGWLRALPPLVQLEALLFRSLWASFVLLSAALLTGVLFVENLLAQHLWHKTVLSVLSWLVLGALLFGRWRYGWRGARALKLTLTSMALLLLAFFGSKFVLEVLLRHA